MLVALLIWSYFPTHLTVVESCDQKAYDSIYGAIIQKTLNAPKLTKKVLDEKNDTIEKLRELCKGQRSSYEKTGI